MGINDLLQQMLKTFFTDYYSFTDPEGMEG